jgi:hypothetical protein
MAKEIGRPKKEIDWKTLDNILQFGARLIDCSDILDLSDDVIQARIKEKFNCTFTEYRERKMSKMRMKLLQKQYDVAMKGNVSMLIWLGKQHLNQKDKHETDIKAENIQIVIDKSDAKL